MDNMEIRHCHLDFNRSYIFWQICDKSNELFISLTADCTTLVWNLKRRIEVKPTSSRVSKCWFEMGNFKSWDTTVWFWFEISGAIQG